MAVVTVKSASITSRDATPRVLTLGRLQGAPKLVSKGVATITSGDSAASKYLFCSVPSNAMVHSVKVSSPDIGTTTTFDLGIYRTTADGSAVVDVNRFATAFVVNAGAVNKTEVVNSSGDIPVSDMEKPLWQALGLTADPSVVYDVVATLVGAADGTGAVLVEIEYSE